MYSNDININRLKREEEMFPIPFVFDTTEWASSQMLGYFHRIAHYAHQLPMHFGLNLLCYVTLSEKHMENVFFFLLNLSQTIYNHPTH